jgi:hypothetical protein
MKDYIVLYFEIGNVLSEPLGFHCKADDADHAEEQCQDANPDIDIVWVWEGDSLIDALHDYWMPDD